jgi:hypothetical protein
MFTGPNSPPTSRRVAKISGHHGHNYKEPARVKLKFYNP